MTVRPPSPDIPLPHLVTKCRLALKQQVRDLKAALDATGGRPPSASSLFAGDLAAAELAVSSGRDGQLNLLPLGHYHARLTYINAYDHLASMARVLGSDGAMSLYSHTTLSRSVAEAAVRHAWLLDPSASYEERVTRYAAVTYYGADNKLKGAKQGLVGEIPAHVREFLISKCTAEFDQVRELISRAGMDLGRDKNGKSVVRIELRGTDVKVALKFETGPLMEKLLIGSPSWYLLSSGVAHSAPWVLDSAVSGNRATPELSLTPDLFEIAGASLVAIEASALLLERYGTYFGFDPEPYTRKSRQRRGILDTLVREQAERQATNPAPLINAAS